MNLPRFRKEIWKYYKEHGRVLPWRKAIHPYKILVSEIMLQQTQVSRVIPKYREFLTLFPNVTALAHASQADVLRAWSGLGYNRRALFLKRAAETIAKQKKFPNTTEELTKLPGVGKNTAGAILAYAFNKPAVFIETNIRRVFIHHFFQDTIGISDADILVIVEKTVDAKNPKEWYWALMDYGSFLATQVENPNRKSKSYVKQSKFFGSLRELRAKILKIVLQKPLAEKKLKEQVGDERFDAAMLGLQKEGFIEKRGGIWKIS